MTPRVPHDPAQPVFNRRHVIQTLIDRMGYRTYLEIGVDQGDTFLRIRAADKTAVDPRFRVSWHRWGRTVLRRPAELRSRYFQVTSDEYFVLDAARLRQRGVDIAFVDGAHTYAQCHADIENALRHLTPDGVVVVHDCNPPSEYAAATLPAFEAARRNPPPGWTHEWCGDAWKAIARLRVERPDLGVCVLDCDYGVGLVTPFAFGPTTRQPSFSVAQIDAMSYADFAAHRHELIGLRPPDGFAALVASCAPGTGTAGEDDVEPINGNASDR